MTTEFIDQEEIWNLIAKTIQDYIKRPENGLSENSKRSNKEIQ